jgi:Putative zinc-finger
MSRREIVWKILTLPCSEAARLSSESLDRTLPAHDRLAVRLHILACVSCRHYRRQLRALRKATTRLAEAVDPPGSSLPSDVRERIKRTLRGD